jgi:hypothetical protein
MRGALVASRKTSALAVCVRTQLRVEMNPSRKI